MPNLNDPAHTDGVLTPVVSIVVDDREKSAVPALLQADPEVAFRCERLPSGDYALCDGHILVERKGMADFVASLKNGRLWEQTDEMRRRSHRPVLIVEGDFFGYRELTYEARRGAALYIARYWNVSFIQSRDPSDTVAWLKTLARHVDDKAQEPRVPKPKDLAGQQLRMLQGIKDIGPGKARKLLEHFGTPAAVVNASEKELAAVVGPKTAEKVFSFVRTEPTFRKVPASSSGAR